MPNHGRLTDWNDERGFGYIKPLDGGPTVFAHITEFPRDKRRPIATDLLTYDLAADDRGRTRAVRIDFLTAAHARTRAYSSPGPVEAAPALLPAALVSVSVLLLVMLLGVLGVLPWVIPLGYLAMSAIAFAVYWRDKAAAEAGRWRTSEAALILIGLIGGWPGALFAQELFRHKTRKRSFRIVFFASIAVNVLLLIWFSVAGNPVAPS